MEKAEDGAPSYTEFDTRKRGSASKIKLLLISYSAVVSTIVFGVLLFGCIYYSQHLSYCKQTLNEMRKLPSKFVTHEEHYKEDGNEITQQVAVDTDRQVEVIRYKGSVVVLDYTRSLTSLYVPDTHECYLIGGIDRKISTPFDTDEAAAAAAEGDDEKTINYVKAGDYPVVDHTMLPVDLQDDCSDIPIYWLERYTTEHDSKLVKRAFCFRACYYRRGIRVCVRNCH